MRRIFLLFSVVLLSVVFVGCGDQEYPIGEEIREPSSLSDLPRVCITTPNGVEINSKTKWVKDCVMLITDAKGERIQELEMSIRGRGNTTWGYPKKPYAIKLDTRYRVLGMPKHKRWVLLANWMDRTLLRNDVAYEMARRTMEWAPRGKFVELFLNGQFLGNYYLCEQIKIDENRVNVDVSDDSVSPSNNPQSSRGYVLEFDVRAPEDEKNYFYTKVKGLPCVVKEPDEDIIKSQEHPAFEYIKDYVDGIEQVFEDDKDELHRWGEIVGLIDVESFIDWWLIHELTYNREAKWPKSCYMYKKQNGKLYAGPVWDFDWGTFTSYSNSVVLTDVLWYGYLFKYNEFTDAVKERWDVLENVFEEVDSYILEQAELIRESNEVNIAKWPISGDVNEDEEMMFDDAITSMRLAYSNRLHVIDDYILNL